jgi:hypothetical protein
MYVIHFPQTKVQLQKNMGFSTKAAGSKNNFPSKGVKNWYLGIS